MSVSFDTLERWRVEALTTPTRERAWSASARLSAVITTAAMEEAPTALCAVRTAFIWPLLEILFIRGDDFVRSSSDDAEISFLQAT
jgi:hypothetical protein